MNLRAGDLVLIRIPFPQGTGSKVRPAVVVFDEGDDDFVAAPVTSRAGRSQFDLTITDWHAAGLNVPSVARIHKLATLHKSDLIRTIGRLSPTDLEPLLAGLCHAYCPDRR
jgi:mRNA-degrading endonuclease toxin of MazEF toxin-antitoxin module